MLKQWKVMHNNNNKILNKDVKLTIYVMQILKIKIIIMVLQIIINRQNYSKLVLLRKIIKIVLQLWETLLQKFKTI